MGEGGKAAGDRAGQDGPQDAGEENQCVLPRRYKGARSAANGCGGVLRPLH